jgi:hypothetical protein
MNLILNAVDALPDGGSINIRAENREGSVRITVADTGIGMEEETRRRVFEPFFTTKANVGTGLGLSMVYGAITRWGGSIQAESEVGRGSTFTNDLHVADRPIEHKRPETDHADLRRGRILIVEDEDFVRGILERILNDGNEIVTYRDGMSALAACRQDTFDVALIDLGLPTGNPG